MDLKPEDLEKITLPEPEKTPDAEQSVETPNYSATVGEPLPVGTPLASREDIISALKACSRSGIDVECI